jgi:hypothetical protein
VRASVRVRARARSLFNFISGKHASIALHYIESKCIDASAKFDFFVILCVAFTQKHMGTANNVR